jgi:broad specificity phosphatase PhoE
LTILILLIALIDQIRMLIAWIMGCAIREMKTFDFQNPPFTRLGNQKFPVKLRGWLQGLCAQFRLMMQSKKN